MRQIAVVFVAVLIVSLLPVSPVAAQQASQGLTVVSAGPVGEIASLEQANEIRVVFSEPMVVLGRIPQPVTAPFMTIRPALTEWLPAEDLGLPCSWHHQSDEGLLVVWPPPYRQWAQQQGLLGDEGIPRRVAVVSGAENALDRLPGKKPAFRAQRFEITNPPAGAIYLLDPTLRSGYQTLSLRALADGEAGEIEWAVNGRSVGKSDPDKALLWSLAPGRHRIAARDMRGRTAETSILVK